jgi:hypothetical protein
MFRLNQRDDSGSSLYLPGAGLAAQRLLAIGWVGRVKADGWNGMDDAAAADECWMDLGAAAMALVGDLLGRWVDGMGRKETKRKKRMTYADDTYQYKWMRWLWWWELRRVGWDLWEDDPKWRLWRKKAMGWKEGKCVGGWRWSFCRQRQGSSDHWPPFSASLLAKSTAEEQNNAAEEKDKWMDVDVNSCNWKSILRRKYEVEFRFGDQPPSTRKRDEKEQKLLIAIEWNAALSGPLDWPRGGVGNGDGLDLKKQEGRAKDSHASQQSAELRKKWGGR